MISKRKITAIFMAAVVAVNLVGCSFKSEKRENKEVLEYLENKYDKEFEISEHLERQGAGPFKPEDFKTGKAYCIDNKDESFDIVLYDNGLCEDNYQNIMRIASVEEAYRKMIHKYWNTDNIYVELKYGLTEEKYDYDNPVRYLIDSYASSNIYIYVLDNNINIDSESKKIQSLVNEFVELGLGGQILIGYVTDYIYDSENFSNRDIWNKYKQYGYIIKYFSKVIARMDGEKNIVTIEDVRGEIKSIEN